MGVYADPGHAASSLDGRSDNRYISRYINLERTVSVDTGQDPVFSVRHPQWPTDIKGRMAARPSDRTRSSKSRSIVLPCRGPVGSPGKWM